MKRPTTLNLKVYFRPLSMSQPATPLSPSGGGLLLKSSSSSLLPTAMACGIPSSLPAPPTPQPQGETYHFVKDHCNEAFSSMNTMRQGGELCDVVLRVGDDSISAHRLVLASVSSYFHAMFTNEMLEKKSSEVLMHDMDPSALKLLVDYAYTSQVTISENNVQVLLPAACLLQMNVVREACCRFLLRQLHPANCLGIRRFADAHACEDLRRLSHQYSLQNYVQVCDTEEFLMLPFKDLRDLIASEELNVENEEQVFTSVIKWIKHDMDRNKHVSELMSLVRLPLLTRDFLMSCVETEEVMMCDAACKDFLIEAMKYHLMPEQRSTIMSERTKERRGKRTRPVIFAVGGGSLFAVHTECEYYDADSDQWKAATPMTTRRSRCGVTVASGRLYAIGGYDGSQDLATAECFNPKSNKWAKLASMGTKRSCAGVCQWNGLVYVAGGYDGASCLSSVERYDPLTLTWTSVTAMALRRRYLKLILLDNHLYAIGGYDGSSHMSSVEKFDPLTNKWSSAPNMISRRSNAGVAVLDGMIYVCGGSDGTSCLSSVERFNPRRNLWEAVPAMQSRRSTHEVVAVGGNLYVIGGNDGSTSLNSIEMFNPRTNKWSVMSSMNMRRSSVGAAVLDMAKPKPTWATPPVPASRPLSCAT